MATQSTEKFLVFRNEKTGNHGMLVQFNANIDDEENKKYPLTIKCMHENFEFKQLVNRLSRTEVVELYNYIGEYLHGKSI